jgi:hypothetical protein
MASNVLTDVVPKVLAQGLMALRELAVTPRIVNNKSSEIAGKRGSTLDVPVSSAITAVEVAPAAYAPNAGALTPDTVPVTLDQWYEGAFDLDDKEISQVMDGVITMQQTEAVRSIVNQVDRHLLGLYKKFYNFQGTAGTVPFGSGVGIADVTGCRKWLNKALAPMDGRAILLDPDAEAAALGVQQLASMEFVGSVEAMREGNLNRRVGFDFWMNQNVLTHTAGTISNGSTRAALTNGALTAGVETMNIDSTTLTGTLLPGDIFSFANHSQTYVVTNASTLTASGNAINGVTFAPALKVAVGDGVTVTFRDTHVVNLAMHRDAIAFATRPLEVPMRELGVLSMSQLDPVSGLTLRVEVTREHKRTRWSYDMLWGAAVVRPGFGVRLAG